MHGVAGPVNTSLACGVRARTPSGIILHAKLHSCLYTPAICYYNLVNDEARQACKAMRLLVLGGA